MGAVSAERIRSTPKEVYEQALTLTEGSQGKLRGLVLEALWPLLWGEPSWAPAAPEALLALEEFHGGKVEEYEDEEEHDKKEFGKGPKKGYNEWALNSVMLEEGNEDEQELGGRTKKPEGGEKWAKEEKWVKKKEFGKGPKKGYNEWALNSVMLEEGNEDEKEL